MKKQILKFGILLTTLVIALSSCKQKDKHTTTEDENMETLVEAVIPINTKLPADVLQSCVIGQAEFNHWFESGSISKNGIVTPANSVTFGHRNNCDFYKWSERMFLWIASPINKNHYNDAALIENQKIVLESPEFYTVSPIVNPGDPKADQKRDLIPHEINKPLRASTSLQKRNSPVNMIDSEEGQATGDALMSQQGSLLYYITFVNDVYAQLLNGISTNSLPSNEFPTTEAQLEAIKEFTSREGLTLKSPNTLAMEIKTSWVEASSLGDFSNYITIDAEIPTYTKTSTTLWTPTEKHVVKKLAMVGMHIVGSAAGHPEMIWATFEHNNNAPNLAYEYLNSSNQTKTVQAETGNDWLLNNNSASNTYNKSHMKYSSTDGTIKATEGQTVSASNTKMINPFGVGKIGVPNPENTTAAASNSQVISVNNSVLGKLIDGDMRKNYIFIGATWTNDGAGPNSESYSANNTVNGVAIGTSQLANSTMETYAQVGSGSYFDSHPSCFACHNNNNGLKPEDLSHVYQDILNELEDQLLTPVTK